MSISSRARVNTRHRAPGNSPASSVMDRVTGIKSNTCYMPKNNFSYNTLSTLDSRRETMREKLEGGTRLLQADVLATM